MRVFRVPPALGGYMSQNFDILLKIQGFLADFSLGMSAPERKFLNDLIFGILRSQSSLLSKIARAVSSEENVKVVYKRLDKNLGRYV